MLQLGVMMPLLFSAPTFWRLTVFQATWGCQE